jgi:hypothetical protein
MGSIGIRVDSQADLTVYTMVGRASAEQVRDVILKFYDGNVTLNVLWDLSKSDVSHLTSSEIHTVAQTPRRFSNIRSGGKTAIVAPADITFGLTRMYEFLTGVQDLPFETRTFRSTTEAYEWLLETEKT